MRNRYLSRLFALVFGFTLSAAAIAAGQGASGDEYSGQWTGTWEGSGSGSFEMLLTKGSDGKPAGKVSVTTDGGNYNADFKRVSIAGKTIEAAYDFPLDPSAEVVMAATVDGTSVKGTWSLRPKGGGAEVASGTFALTKK